VLELVAPPSIVYWGPPKGPPKGPVGGLMAGIGQGRQNRQTGRGGLEGGAPALTCRSLRAERRSDLRTK